MKKLGQVSEAEVISEFLRAEFFHSEYDRDREQFERLVYEPDLEQPAENALRRALLFRRRGHMWRELPPGTRWWEVELWPEEIGTVNIFPRAQWRSPAQGNFAASHVAQQVQHDMLGETPNSLSVKIMSLTALLQREGRKSIVLLIGMDEHHPLTLLEGNHRFIAGMMLPRETMFRRLRFVCGFSPRMEECCWYKTNLPTLSHYLKNRIKYFWDREADVQRLLSRVGTPAKLLSHRAGDLAGTADTPQVDTK
jgi:hypothetical protein